MKKTNWFKNQKIKWSRETLRKPKGKKKPLGRIDGILIYDRGQKTEDSPRGLCCSIETIGNGVLQIWTNGNYNFIDKETAIVLLNKLLDFYGVGLTEINKRITKLEKKNRKKLSN